MPVKLSPEHALIVKRILKEHLPDSEVWAFGSRVHAQNLKPHSDLDLVIRAPNPIPLLQWDKLQAAFSESALPFKTDIVDWRTLSDEFRKVILQQYEVFQTSQKSQP